MSSIFTIFITVTNFREYHISLRHLCHIHIIQRRGVGGRLKSLNSFLCGCYISFSPWAWFGEHSCRWGNLILNSIFPTEGKYLFFKESSNIIIVPDILVVLQLCIILGFYSLAIYDIFKKKLRESTSIAIDKVS